MAASAEAPQGGAVEPRPTGTAAGCAPCSPTSPPRRASPTRTLARQLHLLYDGATLSARMDRDPTAASVAREAAAALLDAAPRASAAAPVAPGPTAADQG